MNQITRDLIDQLADKKSEEGVKPVTVNRMLEVIRAILRKAEREWEWIDRAPIIRMRKEDSERIRWLSQEEAVTLLKNFLLTFKILQYFR